jgi:hypothetical protein
MCSMDHVIGVVPGLTLLDLACLSLFLEDGGYMSELARLL